MPEAFHHGQLLGGEEMGAFEMRFVHQVRGPRVQSSRLHYRGQMGVLRKLFETD